MKSESKRIFNEHGYFQVKTNYLFESNENSDSISYFTTIIIKTTPNNKLCSRTVSKRLAELHKIKFNSYKFKLFLFFSTAVV